MIISAVGADLLEDQQLFRFLDGQDAEHQRVDNAENCGIGADAQSKRDNGRYAEARVLPERAQPVSQVLPEVFDKPRTARIATRFLDLLYAPERAQRREARFLGAHPRGDIVLDQPLEMEAQFFVHLAVQTRGAEKGNHGSPHCVE